jgi:hypothetical protein
MVDFEFERFYVQCCCAMVVFASISVYDVDDILGLSHFWRLKQRHCFDERLWRSSYVAIRLSDFLRCYL